MERGNLFWTVRGAARHLQIGLSMAIHAPTAPLGVEPTPLRRLVERLHEQDATAARELYDRCARQVNGVVWRILGADAEHDDVVQQVFANVFRNLAQLRDPERLESWVTGVAVHTARSEIRRRRVRRIVRLDAAATETAPAVEDHEARYLVSRVHVILQRMNADLHVAFVLRFVEGRSLVETAELCGCSLATIKRRIHKARTRFEFHARRDPDLLHRFPRRREEVVVAHA
jgi:RNA polymerase sigma-70 factor (ECF subfamily)